MTTWARRVVVVLTAAALTACGVSSATPSPSPQSDAFAFQPLWPFASRQEADDWLNRDAPQGHSPWHADAGTTALLFAQNYLGFAEIDRTTAVTEQGAEAWVGVGYLLPNGSPKSAAVVHLVRYGTRPDAGWEVVGTRDDVLTVDTPAYGSTVGQAFDVGGIITGVDESLHLQARQSTQDGLLGEGCCVSAGGENRPWSARITMTRPAQPGVITLVVRTGGHVADVELFAVTGLRVS